MHDRITHKDYAPDVEAMARKKRVCAYARVSSEKDEAFHSLSAQVSYYQQKIAEHPDWEFVEVFSDRGLTGTKENRPGFQAMLTACRNHEVDIVLAKSLTRFARNTVILLNTVRELKSLGIDIHFEEERIETLSAKGELMISILAARAQEESRSASENQNWRIRKSFEKGVPVTGDCYGYRMVNHQMLIDEDEEEIVLRIFSMYLSGMGCPAIAKQLNKEGVKTRSGKTPWSISGISHIISNEKYIGDLRLQKFYTTDYISKKKLTNHGERPQYYVQDAHDPIVDRETFEAVQKERAKRSNNQAEQGKSPTYIFSHLIVCSKCGKHFGRISANAGTKYSKPAWYCLTSKHYGKEFCSFSQRIPENILIQKTCELLDVETLNRETLTNRIQKIIVPEAFTLEYIFTDGKKEIVTWQFKSRRESWTPEMKEIARKRALAQHKRKKEEPNNGT